MIVSICIYIYTLVIITYHILLWSHVWLLHISTFLLPDISKSNIIITNCFTPNVCCSCWLNHHLSSELSQLNHQLCWLNHHVSWLIYDDYINYIRNVRFHPTSLKILKAPRKWWSGSILDDREKQHGNWCKYLYVNQQRWWLNQQSWWFNWESSDDKWWFNQQKTRNMVIEPTIMGSETTSNFWFCRTLGYTVPLFFPRWQNDFDPLDFDQQRGVKQQTWI